MILDNLSFVGIFIASLFLLLPLLFGNEFWRVDEAQLEGNPGADAPWNGGTKAASCTEG